MVKEIIQLKPKEKKCSLPIYFEFFNGQVILGHKAVKGIKKNNAQQEASCYNPGAFAGARRCVLSMVFCKKQVEDLLTRF
jgi:hypothetical protein